MRVQKSERTVHKMLLNILEYEICHFLSSKKKKKCRLL